MQGHLYCGLCQRLELLSRRLYYIKMSSEVKTEYITLHYVAYSSILLCFYRCIAHIVSRVYVIM